MTYLIIAIVAAAAASAYGAWVVLDMEIREQKRLEAWMTRND